MARHLRRLLPHVDRISAVTLMLGGAYLIVYGIYEIRILRNPAVPSNRIVDAVTDLQSHLTNWAAGIGGLRLGLALWLVVATLMVWGISPALAAATRRNTWITLLGAWLVAEGLFHRGNLVVVPVGRLLLDWPARIPNWVDRPWRWATPLELVATLVVALIAYGILWGSLAGRRR